MPSAAATERCTATPETVEGTIPEETTGGGNEDLPALELTGDATAGEPLFGEGGCGACHTLSAAGSGGNIGPNLDESQPSYELAVERIHARAGRHAGLRGAVRAAADRRSLAVPRRFDERLSLILPEGFPREVAAFACDLDGTLVGRDGLLRPRLRAAITRAQESGIPVLVATGRMFRSVERYLDEAGIADPVVCYQGAAVVDPRSRKFLLHEPLELEVAREAIAALEELGLSPNVYVDDELFVARETEYSRAYSGFQRLPVTEVGDLLAWLQRAPTKLVAVAEPDVLAEARARSSSVASRVASSSRRPFRTSFELGDPAVTKGSGIAFVAAELGLDLREVVAFGDGENDVELLEVAGFGFAIEGAHPRLLEIADATCAEPSTTASRRSSTLS